MGKTGLEPAHREILRPKRSASANSATRPIQRTPTLYTLYIKRQELFFKDNPSHYLPTFELNRHIIVHMNFSNDRMNDGV